MKSLARSLTPKAIIPDDYVYFDKGSKWPTRPEGARVWTVSFGRSELVGDAFATTLNKRFTFLIYDFTSIHADPWPNHPRDGDQMKPFWLLMLWHEWHHVINADPTDDLGYGPNPPMTFPVPGEELDCSHLMLDVLELGRACAEVCRLIAEENYNAENCVQIHILCNYIEKQADSYNAPGGVWARGTINCPDVNVIPGSDPPVFVAPCNCCLTYGTTFACNEPGSVSGPEFNDNLLVQTVE